MPTSGKVITPHSRTKNSIKRTSYQYQSSQRLWFDLEAIINKFQSVLQIKPCGFKKVTTRRVMHNTLTLTVCHHFFHRSNRMNSTFQTYRHNCVPTSALSEAIANNIGKIFIRADTDSYFRNTINYSMNLYSTVCKWHIWPAEVSHWEQHYRAYHSKANLGDWLESCLNLLPPLEIHVGPILLGQWEKGKCCAIKPPLHMQCIHGI